MSVHQFPKPNNDNRELTGGQKAMGYAVLLVLAVFGAAYVLRWPLIALMAIYAAVKIFSS